MLGSTVDSTRLVLLADPVNRHHPLNRGRGAWWLALPGLDGGKTLYDLVGRYHGTLTGMTSALSGWQSTSRTGGWGGLLFDRVDDSIRSAPPVTGPPLTLACWYRPNSSAFDRTIIALGRAGQTTSWVRLVAGSTQVARYNSGSSTGAQLNTNSSVLAADTWYRLLVSVQADGSSISYLNGASFGSAAAQVYAAFDYLAMGVLEFSSDLQFFGGALDDASVWSRPLSAAEAQADYDLSRRGYPGVLHRLGAMVGIAAAIPAAIQYHLYKNDGAGGSVDYTTPWATTPALTIATTALGLGSDNLFAVRAYDTVSGFEERNVDARVRILVGPGGADITRIPNPPDGVSAVPRASGTALVTWQYSPLGQAARPTGFHVYLGTPGVSYGSPVATVPYQEGRRSYSATLTGLADATTYQVGVRAYNATAEEANVVTVPVTADADTPDPVDDLTGTIS